MIRRPRSSTLFPYTPLFRSDRLRRYLDSRTRVLAAMSHDLKTPLTRLRLQVETLDNPPMQERIGRELDEMEAMVREALALFRGDRKSTRLNSSHGYISYAGF